MIHYIDDFLIIVPAGQKAAGKVMALFKSILEAVGLPYKEEKTVGPTSRLIYLGVCLDTTDMTASIPLDKKRQIVQLLIRDVK